MSLPNELLFLIGKDPVLTATDLSCLCRTNHHLNALLTPHLIQRAGKDDILVFASQRGFVGQARDAIALGADVEAVDWKHDFPALHWAAMEGHDSVVRLLLDHGASVASRIYYGWTALHWAVITSSHYADIKAEASSDYGFSPTAHEMFSMGERPQLSQGHSMAYRATDGDDDDGDYGDDDDDDDGDGDDDDDERPNFPGAPWGTHGVGYGAVVVSLLDNGAEINAVGLDNKYALHYAIELGDVATVELLLERGADLHQSLHHVRHPELVLLLLARGADINARGYRGQTPLHAVLYLKVEPAIVECVDLLIANGTDIQAQDIYRRTPLHRAVLSSTLEVVKLVLQHGADITARDEKGLTALHYAVMTRRPSIVRLLVQAGADIGIRTNNHSTLLHEIIYRWKVGKDDSYKEETVWCDHNPMLTYVYNTFNRGTNMHGLVDWEEMVKLLLDLGADIFAVDGAGFHPYQWAGGLGWSKMEKILSTYQPAKVGLSE